VRVSRISAVFAVVGAAGGLAAACGGEDSTAAPTFAAPTTPAPTTSSHTTSQAPKLVRTGDVVQVSDPPSFAMAVASAKGGDTIELADAVYTTLEVQGRTFAKPLTIVGSRGAKVGGFTFDGASNVVLQGVTITPPADKRVRVLIRGGSSKIVLDGILVDGREETIGAFVDTNQDTSDVTIRNSDLTNCGRNRTCIRPGAKNLRVLSNRFGECASCDFIKGGGNGAVIQGNEFGRAVNVECRGGPTSCPHNDLIQISGGGPWTIGGNRFGQISGGAAQVYINPGLRNSDNAIHDVRIVSNIFTGEAGRAVRVGIGQKSKTPPPANVAIVNNTFLSGRVSSVELNPPWAELPAETRPVVANNIFLTFQEGNCTRGRFTNNIVLTGTPCPDDAAGRVDLDQRTAAPLEQSSPAVDKADPELAPQTDFYGRFRKGTPDIGAVELGGTTAAAPVGLTAPPLVSRTVAGLTRGGWRITFSVALRDALTLRSTLRAGTRPVATLTQRVAGKSQHRLILPLPGSARRAGDYVLRLEARGAGEANVASRDVKVRIAS
jgi:hypothetical protein